MHKIKAVKKCVDTEQVLKLGGDLESEWDGSRVRLKIREVYPEDEGEYSCIIFNDMGKAVTSATLVVESKCSFFSLSIPISIYIYIILVRINQCVLNKRNNAIVQF